MKTTQKITRAAFLTAACIVLGHIFLAIPNLEMVTAGIFVSGVLLGPKYGVLVGCVAESIFSLFNTMGAPLPPLLVAQVVSMALVGLSGGLLKRLLIQAEFFKSNSIKTHLFLAFLGAALTVIFDILTNLSFVFIAGITGQPLYLYLLAGLFFSIFHVISNAAIFSLIVPVFITRLKTWSTS